VAPDRPISSGASAEHRPGGRRDHSLRLSSRCAGFLRTRAFALNVYRMRRRTRCRSISDDWLGIENQGVAGRMRWPDPDGQRQRLREALCGSRQVDREARRQGCRQADSVGLGADVRPILRDRPGQGTLLSLDPMPSTSTDPPAGDDPGQVSAADDYGVKAILKAGNPARADQPGLVLPCRSSAARRRSLSRRRQVSGEHRELQRRGRRPGDVLTVEAGRHDRPDGPGYPRPGGTGPFSLGRNSQTALSAKASIRTASPGAMLPSRCSTLDAYSLADRTTGRFDLPITKLAATFIRRHSGIRAPQGRCDRLLRAISRPLQGRGPCPADLLIPEKPFALVR